MWAQRARASGVSGRLRQVGQFGFRRHQLERELLPVVLEPGGAPFGVGGAPGFLAKEDQIGWVDRTIVALETAVEADAELVGNVGRGRVDNHAVKKEDITGVDAAAGPDVPAARVDGDDDGAG